MSKLIAAFALLAFAAQAEVSLQLAADPLTVGPIPIDPLTVETYGCDAGCAYKPKNMFQLQVCSNIAGQEKVEAGSSLKEFFACQIAANKTACDKLVNRPNKLDCEWAAIPPTHTAKYGEGECVLKGQGEATKDNFAKIFPELEKLKIAYVPGSKEALCMQHSWKQTACEEVKNCGWCDGVDADAFKFVPATTGVCIAKPMEKECELLKVPKTDKCPVAPTVVPTVAPVVTDVLSCESGCAYKPQNIFQFQVCSNIAGQETVQPGSTLQNFFSCQLATEEIACNELVSKPGNLSCEWATMAAELNHGQGECVLKGQKGTTEANFAKILAELQKVNETFVPAVERANCMQHSWSQEACEEAKDSEGTLTCGWCDGLDSEVFKFIPSTTAVCIPKPIGEECKLLKVSKTEKCPVTPTVAPQVTEPTSKVTEPTSKVTEPATKVTEPTPKVTEPTPKVTEPTPKVTEPTPKVTEPATKPATHSSTSDAVIFATAGSVILSAIVLL